MMKNNRIRGGISQPNFSPSPPLKDLVGKVFSKEIKKVYDKDNPFLGNTYFKLKIISEESQEKNNIFVYPNIVAPQLFRTIQESNYIDKRYLFFCEKKGKRWMLQKWRELTTNFNFNQTK